jgi:hypothetical protein
MGINIVVRGHDGEVFATICVSKPYIMESVDAKALEALAAVFFFFFFSELGLYKVVLE